jgi:pyruvate carboxylase
MAIFMVQNGLTPDNILEKGKGMDFPDSIVSFFEGMMGQPYGGFNKELQKVVLKDKKPITCRPGELLEPEDFDYIKTGLQKYFDLKGTDREIISYAMYPKVYEDFLTSIKKDGNFRRMGSDIFFHGLAVGETCEVDIAEGKTLVITLDEVRDVDAEGYRDVVFRCNGNTRIIRVQDKSVESAISAAATRYAEEGDPNEVGANIPGNIVKVLVKAGDPIKEGDTIAVIEAMKMETNIIATATGTIEEICVKEGQAVKSNELIAVISA